MTSRRTAERVTLLLLIACLAGIPLTLWAAHSVLELPAWCTYPDPAAVAALNARVDAELTDIHRYSPDVHGDVLTLQAAALAECGPFTG
jgi:hypothetical protein